MAASLDVRFNVLLNKFREFVNSSYYKCGYQENSAKENLIHILKGLTAALRLDENRSLVQGHDLELVISILNHYHVVFRRPNLTADDAIDLDLVCECFHLLRNCCAGSKVNQVTIGQCSEFVHNLQNIFSNCARFSQTDQDKVNNAALTAVRCAVQFVGNCISGCPENVGIFWRDLFPVLGELMSSSDGPLKNYTCMVIYNFLLSPCQADQFVNMDGGQLVVSLVLVHLREEDSEWGLYIIQRLLSMKETIKRFWTSLNSSERCLMHKASTSGTPKRSRNQINIQKISLLRQSVEHTKIGKCENLLEVLLLGLELVDKEAKNGEDSTAGQTDAVDETNVTYVAELFSSSVDALLNPVEAAAELQHPKLLYQMLACLCASTSVPRLLSRLQTDSSILRSSIRLLSAVHGSGVLQGIPSEASDEQEALETEEGSHKSPSTFGLKRNIVRLIGNLVYKHKANQDLVRELNAIPLILDQTKIDDTNPFIVQWAVFTIRNLCEGNVENQRIVAEMRLQGLADNVASLREFGVKAELKDGKIVVQPDD